MNFATVRSIMRWHFDPAGLTVDGKAIPYWYGPKCKRDLSAILYGNEKHDVNMQWFADSVSSYITAHCAAQRVAVALSGGIDSTFLAIMASQVTDKLVGVNIELEGTYSELADAQEVADALGIPLISIKVSVKDMVRDIPTIVHKFGYPMDRGSLAAAWYLHKHVPPYHKLLLGQYADSVFSPTPFKDKLTREEANALFKVQTSAASWERQRPIYTDGASAGDRDSVLNAYAVELLHSVPFEPDGLEHFAFQRTELLMPWGQPDVLQEALLQLPFDINKDNERALATQWAPPGFPVALLTRRKKPFNFQPESFTAVADKYLDAKLLDETGIFNKVDWDKQKPWVRYLAALLSLWQRWH